jgi:hypothetical protein
MSPTPFSLASISTPRGHDAGSQAILVSPPIGRGLSTVTTWSERCTSLRSKGNSSGTQYPPQMMWSSVVPHRETSHKSSAVNPIGLQPPPQWLEGKMPPLKGVNLGDFEADDLNIGGDGREVSHHRIELQGPTSSCPYLFCGLEPI